MFGVATFNLPNYTQLADITDASKIEYCNRHGYKFFALREQKYSSRMGFNKIWFTLEVFKQNSDIEWLLFSECDAMITNYTIRIEDRIDNSYHFIIPLDRLGINAGNFMARNTVEGRDYLQMVANSDAAYAHQHFAEQQVIADTYKSYTNMVKLVPQKFMNSYDIPTYLKYHPQYDHSKDIAGNSGAWEQGDWIIHWPALNLSQRLEEARKITKLIVK